MKELTLDHVHHLAHRLAQETMSWNEPIPAFETRFTGRLESCLKTPFQTFGGKDPYPTLEQKAALLFYLLIKNHPFQNGNKRIAVTSLFTFLAMNRRWLSVSNDDLYQLAMWVANSPPVMKDATVTGIKEVIRRNLVRFRKKTTS
ncbi:MAG: type II toxin-antitoxin system death-on-curing family toxin [Deltaproteobacteria bacterium]|nr:type II toxin-antitoxin system death-on-curing family toxin [Deltaproteobacteria bacterium]